MRSKDSEVIILLTVYFNKDDSPLTLAQYSRFAKWLKNKNLYPSALWEQENAKGILQDWNDKEIPIDRIISLLGRGNAMGIYLAKWESCGIWIITRADKEYPSRLKKELQEKCPPVLFGAGNKKILEKLGAAVVGSRKASLDDLDFALKLGENLASQGYSVISGCAKGIDTAAMFGSMKAKGNTLGVVVDDLEKKVLSKKYRSDLRKDNLVLISFNSPNLKFYSEVYARKAMERNKYIYILSQSSVVVHSGLTGGTWKGAVENLKNGWVKLFVKKNDDPECGNNKLLEQGGLELKDLNSLNYLFEKTETNLLDDRIKEILTYEKISPRSIAKELGVAEGEVKKSLENLVKDKKIEKHEKKSFKYSKIIPSLLE